MGCPEAVASGAPLIARLLLDTHILVRWLAAPKKLSREQLRALRQAVRAREPLAVSAISLLRVSGSLRRRQRPHRVSSSRFAPSTGGRPGLCDLAPDTRSCRRSRRDGKLPARSRRPRHRGHGTRPQTSIGYFRSADHRIETHRHCRLTCELTLSRTEPHPRAQPVLVHSGVVRPVECENNNN